MQKPTNFSQKILRVLFSVTYLFYKESIEFKFAHNSFKAK